MTSLAGNDGQAEKRLSSVGPDPLLLYGARMHMKQSNLEDTAKIFMERGTAFCVYLAISGGMPTLLTLIPAIMSLYPSFRSTTVHLIVCGRVLQVRSIYHKPSSELSKLEQVVRETLMKPILPNIKKARPTQYQMYQSPQKISLKQSLTIFTCYLFMQIIYYPI